MPRKKGRGAKSRRSRKAGASLARRILSDHLVSGALEPGAEIVLTVDQALTNDLAGPLTILFLEATGAKAAKPLSVVYVENDLEDAEAHAFLRTAAARLGLRYAPPGEGISHVVHLERYARPGAVLVGTDSHTPTAGAVGSLAFHGRRLDVAAAMATGTLTTRMPRVLGVHVKGRLKPWVGAKDVALHLLGQLTERGGHGKVLEFFGPGLKALEVEHRATIANLGAEMRAVSSIFPADEAVRRWLRAQGRARDFRRLAAEKRAAYDDEFDLDLRRVEPIVAHPPSPDHVEPIREAEGEAVEQVVVGSSSNATYRDIATFALALRRRPVAPGLAVAVAPGSRRVLEALAREGRLADLLASGCRILECASGPCLGYVLRPRAGTASLRTFQRNFDGRTGTPGARVYLGGPEVAAATALKGSIADPRRLGPPPRIAPPRKPALADGVVPPPRDGRKVEIVRSDRFRPLPTLPPLDERLRGPVLLKAGADLPTSAIADPAAPPAEAGAAFAALDPDFARRARAAAEKGGGFVVAAENFGQGSAREDAALAIAAAGVRAVLARSFARVTRENLVRVGVLPAVFDDPADYDVLQAGDTLEAVRVRTRLPKGEGLDFIRSDGKVVRIRNVATPREAEILLAGGLVNLIRKGKP